MNNYGQSTGRKLTESCRVERGRACWDILYGVLHRFCFPCEILRSQKRSVKKPCKFLLTSSLKVTLAQATWCWEGGSYSLRTVIMECDEPHLADDATGRTAASVRSTADIVAMKVYQFQKDRDDQARHKFKLVISMNLRIGSVGCVTYLAFVVLKFMWGVSVPGQILHVFGVTVLSTGILLISICPLKMIDFDEIISKRHCSRLALALVCAAYSASKRLGSPLKMLASIGVLWGLAIAVSGCRHLRNCYRPTTVISAWFLWSNFFGFL